MNKVKRIFVRLAVVLLLLITFVSVLGIVGWNWVCSKYGITYSEAYYSVTSGLVADDLFWNIPEISKGTVGHLELNVGVWSALFGNIKVDDLVLTDADISVGLTPDSDSESDSEISLAIDKAFLNNVKLKYVSLSDSVLVFITKGELEDFDWNGDLELELLQLDDAQIDIYLAEQNDERSPEENEHPKSIFSQIPNLEIEELELNQFVLNYNDTEQQISNSITLKFRDWEKDDAFDFSIDTLYGTVLDTLQIALHLGESEWNDKDEVSLENTFVKVKRASAEFNSIKASNFSNPHIFASVAQMNAPLSEIEKYIGSLDGIVNPEFDHENPIKVNGGEYTYESGKLTLNNSGVWITDVTHLSASGEATWDSLFAYHFQFDGFQTTDQELKSILYPESFYNMYNWPPSLSGNVVLSGNQDSVWVDGLLNTPWGNLDAYSGIDLRADSAITYRLNIKSDKANLYNFANYITVPIREADMDLRILGVTSNIESDEIFSMNVGAETLLVDSFSIDTLHFSYHSVAQYDSMFVFINDSLIEANIRAAITGDDSLNIAWAGDLHHASSTLTKSDLPLWALNAKVGGYYKAIDDYFQVQLSLEETSIKDEVVHNYEDFNVLITEKDTLLMYELDWGSYVNSSGSLNGPFYFHANDLLANPAASLPFIEINLASHVDSILTVPVFGMAIELNIDQFELKNSPDGKLVCTANIPFLEWGNISGEKVDLNIEFDGTYGRGDVLVEFVDIGNADLNKLDFSLDANQEAHTWHLGVENCYEQGKINLGVVESNFAEGYNFKLNLSDTLVLFNVTQQVDDNTGIDFNKEFMLQSGSLSIESEQGALHILTDNENDIELKVDSMNLARLINPFLKDFQIEGLLNGGVKYHVGEQTADFNYSIFKLKVDTVPLGNWKGDGRYSPDDIRSNLTLMNDSIDSTIKIEYGEELHYNVQLNAFELSSIQHFLPDDMRLTGEFNCNIEGVFGETLDQHGWLNFHETVTVLPEINTPYKLGSERIKIEGDKAIFEGFEIFDPQGQSLFVTGDVDVFPELKYNIHLKGKEFNFLDNPKGDGVKGRVTASVDLNASGENQKHLLTGYIDVVPGGLISYTASDELTNVNTLGDLEFVSFEQVASQTEVEDKNERKVFADFDVDINLQKTRIEVILDPVSQEFVELLAQGNVKVRKSGFENIAVFGKIESDEGRAFISLPIVPAIRMEIEAATAEWDGGSLLEPLVSFKGTEEFNSSMENISAQNPQEIVPVTAEIIMLKSNPMKPEFKFDVTSSNPELNSYILSQPEQNRESMATNLLLFGTLDPNGSDGNNYAMNGVSQKLNEILHRNLKYTDLSFSVNNSKVLSTTGSEVSHSELDYQLKQKFMNDRLSVYMSGAVFSVSKDDNSVAPSQVIGNFGVEYKLGETSNWSVIGARSSSYTGVIDGEVTEYKVGFKFSRTYPDFRSFFFPDYRKSIEIPKEEDAD